MVIFKRIQGPMGGIISGGKNPVIPFLLRDKEAGRVKANTGLIKIIININKIKKRLKPFGRLYPFLFKIYKLQVKL